jgi:hypothetical protein
MSKVTSTRIMSSSAFAVLLATAAASSVACSKPEEQKQAWSCASDQVPMGEVVRCTTSAMTTATDAPAVSVETVTVYECDATAGLDSECPSVGSSDTTADTPTADTSVGTDQTTSGSTDGTSSGGPTECSYVPDLEYCAPGSSDAVATDGTTSSSSSGGTDCGKPNCAAPGQDKKASTEGTATSSSSGASGESASGGSGNKEKGKHWKCSKDEAGNRTCTSTPDCASGTHAAACGACVSDSEGATADCVPPSEGGCWVTGGGFIEADSLVPAAAADGHDNFGGNAKPMKGGNVSGHWNHVDHGTGNHAKGRPEYIVCRHVDEPGPGQPGGKKGLTANQVYFGGHAQWRTGDAWADGYWFDVVAKDHGEPGSSAATKKGGMPDSYHFTIRKIDDPTAGASGIVVYETRGELSGGNIQMHPSNNGHPATTSPLPAWVSLEP